jgi:SAM-dependent methyltransferase
VSEPRPTDFGRTAADYARHRLGFPDDFFERLRTCGVGLAGQRVLDVGTGTGQMARGLACGGARVTGLDRSPELLAAGAALDAEASVTVAHVCARAESTGFEAGVFDAVTAAQCWRWFERDCAARELARVLAPGGRLAIAQLDWLPRCGSVVEATEALILAHNPTWELGGLDGLPTHFVGDLERAGYQRIETFSYDVELAYSPAAWRGRIRASAGVAARLAPPAVAAFDAELAAVLAERFPGDPLAVPHRVFTILAGRPERG